MSLLSTKYSSSFYIVPSGSTSYVDKIIWNYQCGY